MPEPESRIEALKGGAIHQVNRLTPASVPEVDGSGVARASQATSASYMTLAMNTLIAPFNDQRVRQALQAASNREQNVAKVIEGLGAVANDHPIAPNDPHYDSSVAIPEYDPKKNSVNRPRAASPPTVATIQRGTLPISLILIKFLLKTRFVYKITVPSKLSS